MSLLSGKPVATLRIQNRVEAGFTAGDCTDQQKGCFMGRGDRGMADCGVHDRLQNEAECSAEVSGSNLHESCVPPLKLRHDLCTLCHCTQILVVHSLVKAGNHFRLQHSPVGFQLMSCMLNAPLLTISPLLSVPAARS